ncbi:pyruvate kinase alpha/beta domain-containing protein [Hathewaya histolytica]|uniref:pyruvate kinase alpha/beta domain-containing protein n=1 Tax=Hathewaya histolytica TaxID=1498 RepID=UPI003B67F5A6
MYFSKQGENNTKETIEFSLKYAKERGIKNIVVASTTGKTAKLLKDFEHNVVMVTYANGVNGKGIPAVTSKEVKELEEDGIKVFTGTHVLSGAERALSRQFGGVSPVEIMAHTLRMLGQGTKVAVEVAVMALDAGLIPYGEDIIAIGGSSHGADTALVISPSHASSILDTKIREVICKPQNWD